LHYIKANTITTS